MVGEAGVSSGSESRRVAGVKMGKSEGDGI